MCLFSASIMALEAALPLGQRRAQRRARSGTIDAKDESDARSGEIFFLENAYLFQWLSGKLSGKSAGQEGRG